MPTALIVDDEDDVRILLRYTIQLANHGLTVVGEAATAEEAIAQWRAVRPEVIVLDHRMPDRSGLDVAEEILREHPEQSIILFSAQLDVATVARAEALGVRACLAKNDFTQVPEAIRRCAQPAA